MRDLADHLYGYIAGTRHGLLLAQEDYRAAAASARAAEEALLASLTGEQAALFLTYAEARSAQAGLEQLHLIREAMRLYFSSTTIT